MVPYRKCLRLKGRWHLFCAMTLIDDNDTPVQSQPCQDAGSRNEGGSERTSEGLEAREEVCRLPSDVFLIPGVLRTKGDFLHHRYVRNKPMHIFRANASLRIQPLQFAH